MRFPPGAETELARMKLYILRHGDAVEPGSGRFGEDERPLTAKGIQRTELLASALRQMEIVFDVILSSPLARACETAEIVARRLRQERTLQLTPDLAPGGNLEGLVRRINALRPIPESVLVVGHEPYLSGLISLVCCGGPGLSLTFKKGGLCRLELNVLSCGKCATLEWLLPPRLLEFKPPKRPPAG
jgi:phosphohistidine phosphatase